MWSNPGDSFVAKDPRVQDILTNVPPADIELGPDADAISIYHEAVHARRAMLGRTMTLAAAEPSAKRAETFARTHETKAHRIRS
jgi:hypothetical protein